MEKVEKLAIRAINQYRRRDILPYIGLRYYLDNKAARRDRWAHEAAVHVVLTRSNSTYHQTAHFKNVNPNGSINHRTIHLPGPNEAMAEAALLDECSKHPEIFQPGKSVSSYRITAGENKEGLFDHYFKGFVSRYKSVARACRENKDGYVRYTDIKRFYPSISSELARSSWLDACQDAKLNKKYIELGEKLLTDHQRVLQSTDSALLTGPMFSHLIANLVLRKIDTIFEEKNSGRYFRYVDDAIFVGNKKEVELYRSEFGSLLSDIGLELHDGGKDFIVSASEWSLGEGDFEEDVSKPSWMTLIGNLRRHLLVNPNDFDELTARLEQDGFRLPIPYYQADVEETEYLRRLLSYSRSMWMRSVIRSTTVSSIIEEARFLRELYTKQLKLTLEKVISSTGYSRKRHIPKLRFAAGRLLFIGEIDKMRELSVSLTEIDETHLLGEVIGSVTQRNVSNLLKFGANAVQSAAQVLRISDDQVECKQQSIGDVERQGISILRLNGVKLSEIESHEESDFEKFSHSPGLNPDLMTSSDPWIAEMACLHGLDSDCRHTEVMNSSFDPDEQMAFDAIDQLHPSSY